MGRILLCYEEWVAKHNEVLKEEIKNYPSQLERLSFLTHNAAPCYCLAINPITEDDRNIFTIVDEKVRAKYKLLVPDNEL